MRADEGASTGAAAGRIADAAAERAGSERWTYLAIAAVGAAFWALPVALSSSIQLDDAELVTIVQGWRLSYDTSQPPLYGWIHQAVSSVLGVSMASTQFVRLALLVLLFAAVYRLGRRITVHAASQYVLLAGYVFFPIISWEGTHYQTHTVLLNLMTVALFLIVVEIRKAPDTGKFLLLGAICGLGLLSKYTFVAILGSVFVATLSVREYRAALLRPAAALSFLVMLMIAVPPTLATVWGLGEVSDFPNVTQEVTNPNVDFASRSLTGAVKLAEQYATQSLLFVAMVALVWGSAARRIDFRKAGRNPDFRFFAVQAVTAFLI
ncbi:MAG: glycosyltransferase family 39 protein, partial [Propylenella sp.]